MLPIKNRHADSVMGAFNDLQKTYSEHFSQVFKTITTDSFVIWIFSYQCSTYYYNLRLDFKRKNDTRFSIGWFNLSTVSDSSILIFNNQIETKKFINKKTDNKKADKDGFYFFLQAIKYDNLPNNIKKIIKMSNIPDIKDGYSVEYYIGISDNIKINDCYVEEYYLILR